MPNSNGTVTDKRNERVHVNNEHHKKKKLKGTLVNLILTIFTERFILWYF